MTTQILENIIGEVVEDDEVEPSPEVAPSRLGEGLSADLSPDCGVENVEVVHGEDGYSFFQGQDVKI